MQIFDLPLPMLAATRSHTHTLLKIRDLTHRAISTYAPVRSKTIQIVPKNREYLNFSPTVLSYHWHTIPPSNEHLRYAENFFSRQPPTFLWSTPKFRSMSFGDSPEVCFLGRSNVGKSSLLNALLGKKIAHTSSKPGRTRTINAFAVGGDEDNGKNRLVVLDMPGYGKGGKAEWGKEIMKYLERRKQLKRAFLLVDAVHGVKTSDEQLLALFREHDISYQVVLAKVDRILFPTSRVPSKGVLHARFADLRKVMEIVKEVVQPDPEDTSGAPGEIIACSSEKKNNYATLGIDSVRHAMLQAAGLEYQPPKKRAEVPEIVPHDQISWAGPHSTQFDHQN